MGKRQRPRRGPVPSSGGRPDAEAQRPSLEPSGDQRSPSGPGPRHRVSQASLPPNSEVGVKRCIMPSFVLCSLRVWNWVSTFFTPAPFRRALVGPVPRSAPASVEGGRFSSKHSDRQLSRRGLCQVRASLNRRGEGAGGFRRPLGGFTAQERRDTRRPTTRGTGSILDHRLIRERSNPPGRSVGCRKKSPSYATFSWKQDPARLSHQGQAWRGSRRRMVVAPRSRPLPRQRLVHQARTPESHGRDSLRPSEPLPPQASKGRPNEMGVR